MFLKEDEMLEEKRRRTKTNPPPFFFLKIKKDFSKARVNITAAW